jgi:hypothetical protein
VQLVQVDLLGALVQRVLLALQVLLDGLDGQDIRVHWVLLVILDRWVILGRKVFLVPR